MTVKEYWEEAGRLRRRIDRKQNEIKSLRERAEGMTGAGFSDMPHTVSPDFNKMQIIVGQIIALEEEVKETQNALDCMVKEMQYDIDSVDDGEARDLLKKRYIEFKPWRVVSEEIDYSIQHTYYLHSKALKKLRVHKT